MKFEPLEPTKNLGLCYFFTKTYILKKETNQQKTDLSLLCDHAGIQTIK